MASQGESPDEINRPFMIRRPSVVLDLFRCQYAVVPSEKGTEIVPVGSPFPRFYVVGKYQVLSKAEVMEELKNPSMDLRETVLLESEPVPKPSGRVPKATVQLRKAEVNRYEFEIVTDSDAILVVTDSYSRDWKAEPLPGNGQVGYRVMVGNYAMRAIPVLAGRHRLRLEYEPRGLVAGGVLSGIGLLAVCGFFCYPWLLRKIGLEGEGSAEKREKERRGSDE